MAGGIESCVAELVPRIQRLRPEWRVRSVHAFASVSLMSRVPFLCDLIAAVILAWKTRKDDAVLINGAEYTAFRALWPKFKRSTIVVWHGTRAGEIPALSPRRSISVRVYALLERALQGFSFLVDRHIAVGDAVERELAAAYGRAPILRVAPNGSSRSYDPIDASALGPRLLWIGTTPYKKGLDLALKACRLARLRVPNLTLTLVGLAVSDVPTDEPWVIQRGVVPRSEMEKVYDEAAIVLASTRYEACSMAMIESISRGKAIVASSAVSWMLGDETGHDDIESLADAVVDACSENGRQRLESRSLAAMERFDWDRSVPIYVSVIEEIISGRAFAFSR